MVLVKGNLGVYRKTNCLGFDRRFLRVYPNIVDWIDWCGLDTLTGFGGLDCGNYTESFGDNNQGE